MPTIVWVKISEKNNIFFRFEISLPQANRKKNYFATKKILQNMVLGTASMSLFELLTFFKSGWDNIVEIWDFDATSKAYSRPIFYSIIECCPRY